MIGVIASPKLSAAPSTAEVIVPYGAVDSQMLVWKVVPLMTAVIVYVALTVSTVGVPLMVHVLLSMFRPVGRFGDAVQEVAPVTLAMPPPEPLPPEPLPPEPLFSPVMLSGSNAHNSRPWIPSMAEK